MTIPTCNLECLMILNIRWHHTIQFHSFHMESLSISRYYERASYLVLENELEPRAGFVYSLDYLN